MGSLDRREMLKLSSAASLASMISSARAVSTVPARAGQDSVPMWEVLEITLSGPSSGNPFTDVQLAASFALGNRTVQVEGFYDGSGMYKIRFMPDSLGAWTYTTSSNSPALSGKSGSFTCVAADPGAH